MRRLAPAIAAALVAFLVFAPPARAEWVWPLKGEVITPYRNGQDPYAGGQHRGIDIAGPPGAPVVAAAAGVVRFAGVAGSSGLTVGIRTGDGGFDTSYLHLSAVSVHEGDRVAAGDALGAVGTSGKPSVARPHLHFGVREAGTRHGYRDPLTLLPPLHSPRPEPPPTAPVPLPTPLRPAPAPGPQAVPAPRRHTVPHPGPATAPRRAPAASGHREPVRPAAAAPHAASAPGARDAAGAPRVAEPAGAPTAGSGQRLGAAPAPLEPQRAPAPDRAGPAPRTGGGGADLGLVFACAGLLLAAAIFSFTGDGRKVGKGPSRLAALLRPIAGR
jgi:hypothetical protein